MSRIKFSQVAALPDAMDIIAFEVNFGTIPVSGNSYRLTLSMVDTNMPGVSNSAFDVTLHGHRRTFRGNIVHENTWSNTFLELSDGETWRMLRNWHEYVVGSDSGNSGGYKADYGVDAQVIQYDTTGAVVQKYIAESIYPKEVPAVQLSGESSSSMKVPVTFSLDRFVPVSGFGVIL